MNEDKAARYHRLGRRAGLLSDALDGRHLCGFMLRACRSRLRHWIVDIAGDKASYVALYVLVLSVLCDIATLPFSFYRGFSSSAATASRPRPWGTGSRIISKPC